MGLGKTVMILALIHSNHPLGRKSRANLISEPLNKKSNSKNDDSFESCPLLLEKKEIRKRRESDQLIVEEEK